MQTLKTSIPVIKAEAPAGLLSWGGEACRLRRGTREKGAAEAGPRADEEPEDPFQNIQNSVAPLQKSGLQMAGFSPCLLGLSNLDAQRGVRTHDSEIESRTLH